MCNPALDPGFVGNPVVSQASSKAGPLFQVTCGPGFQLPAGESGLRPCDASTGNLAAPGVTCQEVLYVVIAVEVDGASACPPGDMGAVASEAGLALVAATSQARIVVSDGGTAESLMTGTAGAGTCSDSTTYEEQSRYSVALTIGSTDLGVALSLVGPSPPRMYTFRLSRLPIAKGVTITLPSARPPSLPPPHSPPFSLTSTYSPQ